MRFSILPALALVALATAQAASIPDMTNTDAVAAALDANAFAEAPLEGVAAEAEPLQVNNAEAANIADDANVVDSEVAAEAITSRPGNFFLYSEKDYRGRVNQLRGYGCKPIDCNSSIRSFKSQSDTTTEFYDNSACNGNPQRSYTDERKSYTGGLTACAVRFVNQRDNNKPTPPKPKYSLVVYNENNYGGKRQGVQGSGCKSLDGSAIRSFQTDTGVVFYDSSNCRGRTLYESPENNKKVISRITPRSVYVRPQ